MSAAKTLRSSLGICRVVQALSSGGIPEYKFCERHALCEFLAAFLRRFIVMRFCFCISTFRGRYVGEKAFREPR